MSNPELDPDCHMRKEEIAFHENRARGGMASVAIGLGIVDPDGRTHTKEAKLYDVMSLPSLKEVTEWNPPAQLPRGHGAGAWRYLQSGKSRTEIANLVGVHRSTISRELRRNSDKRNGIYKPDLAQAKYMSRMRSRKHFVKFTDDLKIQVDILIKKDFSPEQVTGFMRTKGLETVSHETIYQYIWEDKKHGDKLLYKHLRRRGRSHKKRGALTNGRGFIKNRVDIDKRPTIVDKKVRFGDLEIDTVIGMNHKGALLTINDRVTGLVWIRLLSGKDASPLTKAAIDALEPFRDQIHTITADNGKEFSFHEEIARKLNIFVYFAKPYHSWERGANENSNGLIRQYFPKGTDFRDITNEQVMRVQNILNSRPRKRLGYMTPKEKYKLLTNNEFDTVALSV